MCPGCIIFIQTAAFRLWQYLKNTDSIPRSAALAKAASLLTYCYPLENTMPKMKSNRGAAKRFRKTASGKIKRGSAFRRHILTKKSTSRKRHLRGVSYVERCDMRELQRLLPY